MGNVFTDVYFEAKIAILKKEELAFWEQIRDNKKIGITGTCCIKIDCDECFYKVMCKLNMYPFRKTVIGTPHAQDLYREMELYLIREKSRKEEDQIEP